MDQIQRNTVVIVTFTATGVNLQHQQLMQSRPAKASTVLLCLYRSVLGNRRMLPLA